MFPLQTKFLVFYQAGISGIFGNSKASNIVKRRGNTMHFMFKSSKSPTNPRVLNYRRRILAIRLLQRALNRATDVS